MPAHYCQPHHANGNYTQTVEEAAAEAELRKAQDNMRFEMAQAAVDVAGIIDPTPISDGISASMSLYKGDLIGAGLSLVSMVPFVGDALAKAVKGPREQPQELLN